MGSALSGRHPIELDYAEVTRLAGMGLTQAQIASGLGIGTRTLSRRLAEDEDFAQAYETGAVKLVEEMSNVLIEAARKGDTDCAKFILDRRCGWKSTSKQEVTIAPGPSIKIILTGDPPKTGQTFDHAELS